jgi:hypothetical protein
MALIEFDKNPSPTILRWFGLIQSAALAVIGGMVWWRFHAPTVAYVIWGVAAAFFLAYYAIPPLRRSLYLGAMYVTFPLGFVLSHVVLGLIYYVIFTGIGLMLRICGYDPLQRRLDRSAKTYWIKRGEARPLSSYFRQF